MPGEEVVAQVDPVLQEVLQRRRVRRVVDVDDVLHRHPHSDGLRGPPVCAPVPLQRLAPAGAATVGERAGADDPPGVGGVARDDLLGAVGPEDVPRHDRDRVPVGVPFLIVRDAPEVERDGPTARGDTAEPGLPHRPVLGARVLLRLERELHVRGGERLPVTPLDAFPHGDDVVPAYPLPAAREPGNEPVLERVVAEERLVHETDDARVVVGLERVEVRVGTPLLARCVERLTARDGCGALRPGSGPSGRQRRHDRESDHAGDEAEDLGLPS